MNLVFHHVGVVADDLDASVAFYRALFDAVPEPSAVGHVLLRAGAVCFAVVPRRPDDPAGHAWGQHLALSVDMPREVVLARVRALGAPHEEVRRRVYVRDPDGFTLEILAADP